MRKLLFTSTALAMLMAGPAVAQTGGQTGAQPPVPSQPPALTAPAQGAQGSMSAEHFLTRQQEDESSAASFIGLSLVTAEGKKVGEVEDLLIKDDGQIAGAVLAVGGFLGLGSKSIAVPWSEVTVRTKDKNRAAFIALTEQQLADAPEFKTLASIQAEQQAVERRARQNEQMKRQGAPGSGVPAPSVPPTQ
jgi:sporulation protein YlmC with PRC-barrel domain